MYQNLEDYTKAVMTRPSDYAEWTEQGFDNGWGMSGFNMHPCLETLDESNWEVISADLLSRFPNDFYIQDASHWAVGWIKHLRVNTANPEALEAAYEWHCRLEDYPVADDEHFSNKEQEEFWADWENWGKYEAASSPELSRFMRDDEFAPTEQELELLGSAFVYMREDGYTWNPSALLEHYEEVADYATAGGTK